MGVNADANLKCSVWVKVGICTADSVINIALCVLGFVPGLLHAWYIIFKNPEPDYDAISYEPIPGGRSQRRDVENGNVTYFYVSHPPPSQRAYGAVSSQQAPAKNQTRPNNQHNQGDENAGSSSANPPPTYAEAVKGDNKVQTQDE